MAVRFQLRPSKRPWRFQIGCLIDLDWNWELECSQLEDFAGVTFCDADHTFRWSCDGNKALYGFWNLTKRSTVVVVIHSFLKLILYLPHHGFR